jgi:hypothetical protein
MESDIERLDETRMLYLKWYLIGFTIFILLFFTRHFFRQDGLNEKPIGYLIFTGLVLTILLQAYTMFRYARLAVKIHRNPSLETALNNELIQYYETRSWIAAFIGSVASTLIFAVTYPIYPICDPVTISLTAIVSGLGIKQAYFYVKYKSS